MLLVRFDDGVACRSNCKPLYPESADGERKVNPTRIDIGSDGKAQYQPVTFLGNRELDEAALRVQRRQNIRLRLVEGRFWLKSILL